MLERYDIRAHGRLRVGGNIQYEIQVPLANILYLAVTGGIVCNATCKYWLQKVKIKLPFNL
jgi:hypothetical protein